MRTEKGHYVASARELAEINRVAVERGYNRAVTDEFIELLDPEGHNVSGLMFSHDHKGGQACEPHWRINWYCSVKGSDEPVSVIIDTDPDLLPSRHLLSR